MIFIPQALRWIAEVAPSHADSIRGCSDDEVAILERSNGREVPVIYREFLKCMGHDAGLPLLFAGGLPDTDVNLSVKAVTKVSRKMKWRLPTRFTRIGVHENDPDWHFYLDEEPDPERPRVVRFCILSSDPASIDEVLAGDISEVARSLPDLLFASAVASYVFPHHPVKLRIYGEGGDEEGLRRVGKVFEKLGFVRHPALRATSRYFIRSDGVALVQLATARQWIYVDAHLQSAAVARQLVPRFKDLGLWTDYPME